LAASLIYYNYIKHGMSVAIRQTELQKPGQNSVVAAGRKAQDFL
jgi:hypothetical protein